MVLTSVQKVFSVSKEFALWFWCWPRTSTETIDGKSITSTSTESVKEKTVLSQRTAEKDRSHYYLTWPDHHFAISEYNWSDGHFINLNNLTVQDRLVARALSEFSNTRPDYADPEIPYENSFGVQKVFDSLRQLVNDEPDFQWSRGEYYIVAYYSTLRSDLDLGDREKLAELDEAAFREALPSKAFLRYWFGRPDDQGRNLATCFWTNQKDARRTLANGPFHRRAAREGEALYQKGTIDIREYALSFDDDMQNWTLKLLSRRIHA